MMDVETGGRKNRPRPLGEVFHPGLRVEGRESWSIDGELSNRVPVAAGVGPGVWGDRPVGGEDTLIVDGPKDQGQTYAELPDLRAVGSVLVRPTDNQVQMLSLIHISEPTRRTPISYAVFCLK